MLSFLFVMFLGLHMIQNHLYQSSISFVLFMLTGRYAFVFFDSYTWIFYLGLSYGLLIVFGLRFNSFFRIQ